MTSEDLSQKVAYYQSIKNRNWQTRYSLTTTQTYETSSTHTWSLSKQSETDFLGFYNMVAWAWRTLIQRLEWTLLCQSTCHRSTKQTQLKLWVLSVAAVVNLNWSLLTYGVRPKSYPSRRQNIFQNVRNNSKKFMLHPSIFAEVHKACWISNVWTWSQGCLTRSENHRQRTQ